MEKHRIYYQEALGFVCVLAAIVMTFVSLFLPPPGEIHTSVLILVGEVLCFVGALVGINAVASNNIQKIASLIKDVEKKDGK